jgi:hypothetical protein
MTGAVIAVLALAVAASGTATAAVRAHAGSGDHLIKKRSLSGNRLRPNSVTGTQINENTLRRVPIAAAARSVDGDVVINFRKLVPTNTLTPAVALNALGLKLDVSCDASGQPTVRATLAQRGQLLLGHFIGQGSGVTAFGTSSSAPGDIIIMTSPAHDRGTLSFHYVNTNKAFMDLDAVSDRTPTIDGFDGCLLQGTAIAHG